jgi:hypothetical protein
LRARVGARLRRKTILLMGGGQGIGASPLRRKAPRRSKGTSSWWRWRGRNVPRRAVAGLSRGGSRAGSFAQGFTDHDRTPDGVCRLRDHQARRPHVRPSASRWACR